MNTTVRVKPEANPVLTLFPYMHGGLLQRECACDGMPGLDRECAECQGKRLSLRRLATA